MGIELRDLKWAIIASQHRSLRQAAEALNVRQSTLSRRLRDMEAGLGAQLFERTNGGTRLTVAGREFLATAHQILADTDTALRRLQTKSRGENGRLSVGVYTSLSTGNMFATLVEHHRRYPDVEIYTVDGSHEKLFSALGNNTVDIAVMTTSHAGWEERMLPLWSERVIVAVPRGHALAKTEVVHWPELAGEQFLLPQQGAGRELERLLIANLGDYGPQQVLRQESALDRLLSLVAAEHGVILMLEGATGLHHHGVAYREIHNGDGPTRLNFAAYWRHSNRNPTLVPFVAILKQRYPDLSGAADQD